MLYCEITKKNIDYELSDRMMSKKKKRTIWELTCPIRASSSWENANPTVDKVEKNKSDQTYNHNDDCQLVSFLRDQKPCLLSLWYQVTDWYVRIDDQIWVRFTVPFWYASASYQAPLFTPWLLWGDCVLFKYGLWQYDMTKLVWYAADAYQKGKCKVKL